MAKLPDRGASFFYWLFIVVGLAVAGVGVSMVIKSLRTEYWPVTEGVIRSSEQKSNSSGEGGATYSAAVTYTYKVGGVDYTGDKVSVGQMSASSAYAQKILQRYPVGKSISVHYAPNAPAEAVLEIGIHGGTWICLAVGTAFALFGTLFVQIQRAAVKAQVAGPSPSSSITMQPNGDIEMNQPPILMGIIFLLVGGGICFVKTDNGTPNWIILAVGGVFASGGLLLLFSRLKHKIYSKIMTWVVLIFFLTIFHWVSFGLGDRTGTATTPFSGSHSANVRMPFAIMTILFDVLIVAGLVHSLFKRRND